MKDMLLYTCYYTIYNLILSQHDFFGGTRNTMYFKVVLKARLNDNVHVGEYIERSSHK